MRRIICSLVFFLGFALSATAQKARPQFRPAVLPSGPESLINRIDAKELIAKGQKDGAVQFCAVIAPTGDATSSWTYHAMPDCSALQAELEKRLTDAKFVPAIYEHQPVSVLLFGTLVFSREGSAHLHIFLNQDPKELKQESDFIAPQPVMGGDSKFTGLHLPGEIPVAVTGVVELALRIDAKGTLQEIRVTGEDPPLLGFRDAALRDFDGAKFIPAFRSGDAAANETIQPVCYKTAVMEPEIE